MTDTSHPMEVDKPEKELQYDHENDPHKNKYRDDAVESDDIDTDNEDTDKDSADGDYVDNPDQGAGKDDPMDLANIKKALPVVGTKRTRKLAGILENEDNHLNMKNVIDQINKLNRKKARVDKATVDENIADRVAEHSNIDVKVSKTGKISFNRKGASKLTKSITNTQMEINFFENTRLKSACSGLFLPCKELEGLGKGDISLKSAVEMCTNVSNLVTTHHTREQLFCVREIFTAMSEFNKIVKEVADKREELNCMIAAKDILDEEYPAWEAQEIPKQRRLAKQKRKERKQKQADEYAQKQKDLQKEIDEESDSDEDPDL